jgi:hypothetical protein
MQRQLQLKHFLTIVMVSTCVGYLLYQNIGPSSTIEKYYFEHTHDILNRLEAHTFDSPIVTYRQSGFWGEGLGTATQGAHHLKVSGPRTWQEGTPGRMLVELGVPGFVCFIYLGFSLVKTNVHLVTRVVDPQSPAFALYAGLFAVFFANIGSFIVSHQILGDPFVVCFFALLIGFILSASRITAENGDSINAYVGPGNKDVSHALRGSRSRLNL